MTEYTDPYTLFATVFAEAKEANIPEPTAFCLATVDADGRPSSRMVLLKGFDDRGFVFYTNLKSRKAVELNGNPNAALCFFWPQIGRQIRIEGVVEQVSDDDANEYFRSRPRGSQIGAWASIQSSELSDRSELIERIEQFEKRYADEDVPRPDHWSGLCVKPRRIEFWTAGEFRLHDRLVFESTGDGSWRTQKLYP